MRTTAQISVVLLSLGLIAGCATMGDDSPAGKAIAEAKAANKKAKGLNYEWRDTGKTIKKAEAALDDGDAAGAMKQANKAKKQANDAIAQASYENEKYLNSLSKSDRAALKRAMKALSSSDVAPAPKKRAASTSMGGKMNSYSVVGGDNLWDISGKSSVYDNPYQWPLIYKTNRSKIKDADLIYPGQRFDIDQNASASDINAAVNHAKTRGAWSVGDVEQSDRDYLSR
jgi:nucleoid-associated protein YgaU